MATARTTALSALIATRRQDAWSDGVLKQYIARDALDRRDAALASQLCYGVLQNRALLEYELSQVLSCKFKDLQPVVADILLLGAYQVLLLERVPDSAAVNEAVEQCKTYGNRRAAGLVNGVLRSLSRQKGSLRQPDDLETKYSHPAALVVLLRENLPEGTLEAFLAADNAPAPMTLQYNPLKTQPQAIWDELTAAGVRLTPHPWLPDCMLAEGAGDLTRLPAFCDGRVYVQDAAAALAARCAGAQPGMRVLDVCAAPGGKSFAMASRMENRGEVLSCDIHPHKIALLEKGAQRLGITNLHACVQDASARCEELIGQMDIVVADVPCSGLGVIRKKPDIRYKDLAPMERLPQVQRAILENVSAYVKPGGVLLYSTCTVLRRENEDVAQAFLQAHPEFCAEVIPLPDGLRVQDARFVTLLPGQHDCDGFFICKMRKQA